MKILVFDTIEAAASANQQIEDQKNFSDNITTTWANPVQVLNGPYAGKWAIFDPAVNGTYGGIRDDYTAEWFDQHPGEP